MWSQIDALIEAVHVELEVGNSSGVVALMTESYASAVIARRV
jgi:hypothetical protein